MIPLVVALTTAVALGVRDLVPTRYTAEAVLAVPAIPDHPVPSTDQAGRQAAIYAQILPRDRGVLQRLGKRLSRPPGEIAADLTVRQVHTTPVLRVRFRASAEDAAIAGASAAATAMAQPGTPAARVEPGSIAVVRQPRKAQRAGPTSWRAEAVLLVSPSSASAAPGSAAEANSLARTYATILPEDRRIRRRVAAATGLSRSDVVDQLTVANDFETSVIRATFEDDHARTALRGVRALAAAATAPIPASPRITPASIRVVRVADHAEESTPLSGELIPVAVVLGLLLGLVLVVVWDRADPRVDDLDAVAAETFSPVSRLDGLTDAGAEALVERWRTLAGGHAPRVALVPVGRRGSRAAAYAARRFEALEMTGADRFLPAARPGGPDAGERVAQSADLTVLVVVRGARRADVRRTVGVLEHFGAPPRWALLVGRRTVRRADRRARRAAETPSDRDRRAPVGSR
ncbi:MAG TPA: hypothetical protein VFR97_14710 [Capillimicrobium sp.]|nr:hypothetical protein [Capillimicrobium sp.]